MKRLLSFVLSLLIASNLFSQEYRIRPADPSSFAYITKNLVYPRTIEIHSTGRNELSGASSRGYIEVVVPSNCIEWYYTFTTSEDQSFKENLKLGIQLAQAVSNFTPTGKVFSGLSDAVLQNISTPPGKIAINSYVLTTEGINPFLNGQQFGYLQGTDMLSTLEGKMKVPNWTRGRRTTYYIGLQNLSYFKKVQVSIEVVALVFVKAEQANGN